MPEQNINNMRTKTFSIKDMKVRNLKIKGLNGKKKLIIRNPNFKDVRLIMKLPPEKEEE